MTNGRVGISDGMRSYVLMDDHDHVQPAYSISAGLDYPGVGPEHSYLKDTHRTEYYAITDDEAVRAFQLLSALRESSPPWRVRTLSPRQ